jgi:hypothetical protein
MATRDDLKDWIIEALNAHKGRASIVEIFRFV